MSQQPDKAPKRLLLYVHFDQHGRLDPHVLYQIQALRDFGMEIVFISNSPLDDGAKKDLAPLAAQIRERPDEGYDWTAWKEALLEIGPKKLSGYDEVIIMNDSTYGPLFPLEEMFSAMAETGVDFWGLTRDQQPYYGEHLQPYFCVFRPRLFNSREFWNFWKYLPKIASFKDAVIHGELAMTRIFNESGFLHGAYADFHFPVLTPGAGTLKPLVYTVAPWLISEHRVPFAKIKAFSTWPGKQSNIGPEFFRALDEAGSKYPRELVKRHLRRTRPLSWQKNLPGFLRALPEEGPVPPDPGLKTAIYAHLFYEDQFEEGLNWLTRIPYAFDLYVSTSSDEKKARLLELVESRQTLKASHIEIRIFKDHGRDVAPWLFGFQDVQENYDLALKFHLKKRRQFNPVFTKKWFDFILESTLASPAYVGRVIEQFHNGSNLGLAFHTIPPALLLHYHAYSGAREDRKAFDSALNASGVKTPVETSFPLFPQNIFWYRPKALEKLFHSGITLADFPEEPFPANGAIAHGIERAIPYIAAAGGWRVCQIIPDRLLLEGYQQFEDHLWHWDETTKKDIDKKTSPWKMNAWEM